MKFGQYTYYRDGYLRNSIESDAIFVSIQNRYEIRANISFRGKVKATSELRMD